MARNNFPSSAIGRDGMVIPARQVTIEDDAHICQEVCGDFFAFDVDPAEHLGHYLRPGGFFGLCHEVPGNVHGVKRHALTGARYMGKQALVNTSRSALIDTGALVSALEQGRPGFAALDVLDVEPLPADSPLRQLPNALLTRHLGFVAEPVFERFASGVSECLRAWLAGQPLVRVMGESASAA